MFAMRRSLIILVLASLATSVRAEDGYELWLRYHPVSDPALLEHYRTALSGVLIEGGYSPTLNAARDELRMGLGGLLAREVPFVGKAGQDGILVAGTPATSALIAGSDLSNDLKSAGDEGFVIRSIRAAAKRQIIIGANTDVGVLHGVFHFLRLLQTHQRLDSLSIAEAPRIRHRLLNHWDNLDGTVERGYAGFSLWDWHKLPDYLPRRYKDYARANASIGINGTVLTNVNANAVSLTPEYLKKAAGLAAVFRPYAIRVYLTARFSAPIEIGGLKTADPLDPQVQGWWKQKADEIYRYIPDFGGFLVKANSEGQPGPQQYGRTHADGANLLGDALAPHGGIVIWRAFVYDDKVPDDRAKQAYNEFKPLDEKFRSNVLIQVKNGPIDFQPREPFHPLFGAMPGTPLMMEFQVTKEYLGFATHLAYLGPLFKEALDSDTFAKGAGSSVARVIDGSLDGHTLTGIAGVANIGSDRNWCGSVFAQANWFAYGRLAWDHALNSEAIASEWIRMTFSNDPTFVRGVSSMMVASREAVVEYMTPLGLHHLMARDHHHGPGPWVSGGPRSDWTSVYYHRADENGIGFDRTATGSNAVAQYYPPVADGFASLERCPDAYLLWFHHVGWNHKMRSGRTLWEEICRHYQGGVEAVRRMQATWQSLEGSIDSERYEETRVFLKIQEAEARWWRDACVLYFQTFSNKPIPKECEQPDQGLDYYKSIVTRYVPGTARPIR